MSDWGATHSTVAAANAGLGILARFFLLSSFLLFLNAVRPRNARIRFLWQCVSASGEFWSSATVKVGRHGYKNSHWSLHSGGYE
jgi:hypothetical protein